MLKKTAFKAIAVAATMVVAASLSTSFAVAAPATPAGPNDAAIANANESAAFWTADKLKSAKAFDMVFDQGSSVGRRVPVARTGSGTASPSALGSRWISGGLAASATGKVFFSVGGSYYQCSGSLVKDGKTDRSIVLTAGHCIWDNATSAYVKNFIFIPNYDSSAVSTGNCSTSNKCWAASQLFANPGFTSQSAFTSQATWYDWGFATIFELKNGQLPDGGSGAATDGTNSFPISFTAMSGGTSVYAFGYPAATPYNGQYLIYSNGKVSFDSYNSNKTYKLASDMTGGASGGPWFSNFSTTPAAQSLNSYKYGSTKNMYGPIFNSSTAATYSQALDFIPVAP